MLPIPAPPARRLLRRLLVPAAALAALWAVMPLTPAAAQGATRVVGTLVQAWPEQRHEESATLEAAPLSWVKRADGSAVRVPTGDLADVPAGSTVQVTVGGPVRDVATTVQGYDPARDVLSADVLTTPAGTAPATAAGLTDRVTVAMVVPPGGQKDGATLDELVSAVNGPVARFWSGQSNGAIRLGVTAAHDWITTTAGCADPTALWDQAAAKVGFTPGPGRHLLVYLSSQPKNLPGCSYGLGQVGSGLGSGGSLYVRDALPSLIAHELGHNFGLGHSSERQCDGAVETGSCQTQPYRDFYDVMGASWEQVGSLNAAQADRLGLLPASAELTFASTQAAVADATLAPLGGTGGTRAVRLTGADGTTYWLEYRSAIGQDAWLDSSDNRFDLQSGVVLHRGGQLPDTSLLLDGTPGSRSGWDGDLQTALPVGRSVVLAAGQFTVTVRSVSAGAALLSVRTAPVSLAAGSPAGGPAGAAARGALPGSGSTHRAPGSRPSPGSSPQSGPAVSGTGGEAASASRGTTSPPSAAAVRESASVAPISATVPAVALVALAGCSALVMGVAVLRRRRGARP